MEGWYTTKEAAGALNCSIRSVQRLCVKREIEFRCVSGRYVIPRRAIDEALATVLPVRKATDRRTRRTYDQYSHAWACDRGSSNIVGQLFMVLTIPSSQSIPLPSPFGPCLLRGSGAIVVSRADVGANGTWASIGIVPVGADVYIQGVFMLYATGNGGRRCPYHLSVTPTWRVRR